MPSAVTHDRRLQRAEEKDGLRVSVYRGDGAAMLAFDLEESLTPNLAGFAIHVAPPKGQGSYLLNRLNFGGGLTSEDGPEARVWTSSVEAPFQKFRWVDFAGISNPGTYHYEVSAMYFASDPRKPLLKGPTVAVDIDTGPFVDRKLEVGFTRSYISSQAYATKFKNAPIRPDAKKALFDTKPFEAQYEYLGAHARAMVFSVINEALNNPNVTIDVFAYDLDEPDFVRALVKMGKRIRLFLDDADLHTKPGAREIEAFKAVSKSAGAANVTRGKFRRFAHNKIVIIRDKDRKKAIKVLTGSANFSVRGLYVQANNVIVFSDPTAANLYAQVFDTAFSAAKSSESKLTSLWEKSELSQKWFDIQTKSIPAVEVAFSPHKNPDLSLGKVSTAINGAQRSLMYAIMELGGTGSVVESIVKAGKRKDLFNYGMTQNQAGVTKVNAGKSNALVVPFAFLHGTIPQPFRAEVSGGAGQVIHHKFVVVDFNGDNPAVFTGSSNLAKGGEASNGDNLLAITDREVATIYGVEAVRLVDHFHFRAAWKNATSAKPLQLQGPVAKGKPAWWSKYFDETNLASKEREMLSLK